MKAADKAELELLFGHLKEGGDEVDIKDGDNRLANHHIDMYMWLCRRDFGDGRNYVLYVGHNTVIAASGHMLKAAKAAEQIVTNMCLAP